MTVSKTVLRGPMIKVARANTHLREIEFVTHPLFPKWYRIVSTFSETGGPVEHPQCAKLIYEPTAPVAELLAVMVGDVIHNLRSALDHLAAGLVRTLPGSPLGDRRPHFPMSPERAKLDSDQTLAAMEQALPGTKQLVLETLRPENGPDETAWRLNVLNNVDKHNLIIPAVTVSEISNLNATWGDGNFMAREVNKGDATRSRVLMETGEPITIGNDVKTFVEVTFAPGSEPYVGMPVVPTLVQMRDLVAKVLQAFEDLINSPKSA